MRERMREAGPEKFITAAIVNAEWPYDQAGTQKSEAKIRARERKIEPAAAGKTPISYPDPLKEPGNNIDPALNQSTRVPHPRRVFCG
jgi:hypothetical protein